MPRKPREFVGGGIYHVFNRGNNRRILFESKEDFDCFKGLLYEGCQRAAAEIFHYCLMSNHYHLLVRGVNIDSLPQLMHWVQLGYARYYKKRHKSTGHVFEVRYRSPRIAEESYYLQCGRYIERNPVKAKMVKMAEDYPHSSAGYYVSGKRDPLVTENLYYKDMGKTAEDRQRAYKKFVKLDEPYAELIKDQLMRY